MTRCPVCVGTGKIETRGQLAATAEPKPDLRPVSSYQLLKWADAPKSKAPTHRDILIAEVRRLRGFLGEACNWIEHGKHETNIDRVLCFACVLREEAGR